VAHLPDGEGAPSDGDLFPLLNAQKTYVVAPLSAREEQVLTRALRKMVMGLESAVSRSD
jgi:hypothetical protein